MPRIDNFDENLKRGLEFEQGVGLALLHTRFPNSWIINNKVDPTETTNGVVGPRAYRGLDRTDEIALPDYQVITDDGEIYWIDAKLKGAAYPEGDRKYFTIDMKINAKYAALPQWMVEKLWLLFYNERTHESYLTRFRIKPDLKFFRNKYGTGNVPIYYVDTLTKIN